MEAFIIKHVENAIYDSFEMKSKISKEVLDLEGMSGIKTRHLYNNICAIQFENRKTNYLEIGTWKGSSLISSLFHNNHLKSVVVDNWSQFGDSKDSFEKNVNTLLPGVLNSSLDVINEDCFAVDITRIKDKIDIYLYDGGHTFDEQRKAISYYSNVMNDVFILIVDDWNWLDVRDGTFKGIDDMGYTVLYKKEIRHTDDNSHSIPHVAKFNFWNGVGIFVIRKSKN